MQYKVILFDADGVTIDSGLMFSQILERDYNIPLEKMLPFFTGVFQECMFGQADLKIELEKVKDEWGWKKTIDELLEEWFAFENKPNKEMFALIKRLRENGVKCYLATNQEKYRGDYLRKEMGFDKLFDGLFISAEIGYKKKEPKFFEEVYTSLNEAGRMPLSVLLEKNEILFIDNEEENIDSAIKFGIDTHLFTDMTKLKELIN